MNNDLKSIIKKVLKEQFQSPEETNMNHILACAEGLFEMEDVETRIPTCVKLANKVIGDGKLPGFESMTDMMACTSEMIKNQQNVDDALEFIQCVLNAATMRKSPSEFEGPVAY